VLAQAGLGLRLGELLALRVEDVDFLHRSVQVDGQFAPDGRTRVEPKTPRSRRTVPLPDVVGEALAQHIAAYPPRADGTIFLDSNGAAWRSNNYGSALFGAAVKRAGLPPGTTTHDLRHHYASVLIHAGESVVTVTERLGHENAVLVMTTYAHIMPDTEERTRAAVDAAWAENSLGATALRANEGSPWRG
jgi:integrase